jgi:hypothetical protein
MALPGGLGDGGGAPGAIVTAMQAQLVKQMAKYCDMRLTACGTDDGVPGPSLGAQVRKWKFLNTLLASRLAAQLQLPPTGVAQ